MKNGTPLYIFSLHSNWVRALWMHHEGRYLFSGSDDERIIIWDLYTGLKVYDKKSHEHFILDLAFHPKYNFLASMSTDCMAKIWEFLPID